MTLLVAASLIGLAAVAVALWKFGFIAEAEHPIVQEDKLVLDLRQRKALLSRLSRWREEGKLTRAEYDRVLSLCESDW